MKQISILGCGWLGLPLAKNLIENQFVVKGSTTSTDKVSQLKLAGIKDYQIILYESEIVGNIDDFLKNSTVLIIDIPPKLRTAASESFVNKIQKLVPHIEQSTIKKLIFISSTSVYGDAPDSPNYSEESEKKPDTESGKQLLQTEELLLKNHHFETAIVRFGGLIGENRHPIKSLSGKQHIENPLAAINLIHLQDCIGIIRAIIEHKQQNLVWNQTYNAVSPYHPIRKEYYTQKALEFNLDLPHFSDLSKNFGKTIVSHKIEHLLGYQFQNPML